MKVCQIALLGLVALLAPPGASAGSSIRGSGGDAGENDPADDASAARGLRSDPLAGEGERRARGLAGKPVSPAAPTDADAGGAAQSQSQGQASAGGPSSRGGRGASTSRPGAPFDRAAAEAQRQARFDLVQANHGSAAAQSAATRTPSQAEVDAIVHAQPQAGTPQQVGLTLELSERLTLGGPAGVYEVDVTAPNAAAVNLRFTDFNLPAGTEAWLYCDGSGQVYGPYTGQGSHGNGDFWSHTVSCDRVVVQVDQAEGLPSDGQTYGLTVSEVGYIVESSGRRRKLSLLDGLFGSGDRDLAHCSNNADCVMKGGSPESASCLPQTLPQPVADARYGVGHMLYNKGGNWYICSGGLLNDSLSSQTPYFLTANHCISDQTTADTLQVYFQFWDDCEATSCTTRYSNPQELMTQGATILSTSVTSDYNLLVLNQAAPAGSAFLGWTNSPVAFNQATQLYRFSHPNGSPQAYSEQYVDTAKPTCGTLPRGEFIYSTDTYGATEGGSSGSPILNAAGEVVGQLYGACGQDSSNPCYDNAVVDGALAYYYDDVAQWLEGCTADADCDDGNACTGTETCVNSMCVAGTPINCDDGQFCNGVETCVPSGGSSYTCVSPTSNICDDNNFCNGEETCDEGNDSCVSGTPQCTEIDLTTPYSPTAYNMEGFTFDLAAAGSNDLSISSMEFMTRTTGDLKIYSRAGTGNGYSYTTSGWNLEHSGSVTGDYVMRTINFATPVSIPAGTTRGFFVFSTGALRGHYPEYAASAWTPRPESNADLTLSYALAVPYELCCGFNYNPRTDLTGLKVTYSIDVQTTPAPVTATPTSKPTSSPTASPVTASPTSSPTQSPTTGPTVSPTSSPTASPVTASPTSSPTQSPTTSPTVSPTSSPTASPVTASPTVSPVTASPTVAPIWVCVKNAEERLNACSAPANMLCSGPGDNACRQGRNCESFSCAAPGPSPTPQPVAPTAPEPTPQPVAPPPTPQPVVQPTNSCTASGGSCAASSECCSQQCTNKRGGTCK